jgi:muramoyltetrapeptide carboxypeptidase
MHTEPQLGRRVRAVGPQGKLGVVSPASCVERSDLEAGCRALGKLNGWQVETSPAALQQSEGGFAGDAAMRAAALMEMWQRDDVDAVICSRGGYGTNYLLPLLDFDALRMMPKAFVGYSDNTCLLLALERAGLIAFHGPMVASDFACGRADEHSFCAALGGKALDLSFSEGSAVETLVAGEACGTITGGCLSVVVTSLGTPWEIETEGRILFLEDVNERPYRIDRMLRHLLLAGKFCKIRGMIFGQMRGCAPDSPYPSKPNAGLQGTPPHPSKPTAGLLGTPPQDEPLAHMLLRVLDGLNVPIVFGFPSGHVDPGTTNQRNITLPFGVQSVLQASRTGVRLQVEPAAFMAVHYGNT